MKANEAPEKIYVSNYSSGLIYNWHSKRLAVNDIEYTRTDAFIEKAISYLEETLFDEVCYGEIRPDIVQAYIDNFKKVIRQ